MHCKLRLLPILALLVGVGCSSDSSGGNDGSGGSSASGGTAGAGASSSGGSSASGGTFSIGGSSSFGGTAGGGGGPTCDEELIESNPKTANVLLVLDVSGSMLDGFDGTEDPPAGSDKWSAMRDALGASLGDASDVAFGLLTYPRDDMGSCGTNCCDVPTGAAAVQVAISGTDSTAIVDELPSITPNGGTPTAAALRQAREYFENGAGASLEGDRYVLLATDGGPNCDGSEFCSADSCIPNVLGTCALPGNANCCGPQAPCDSQDGGAQCAPFWQQCLDENGAVAEVEALQGLGVDTFVLGMPGVEAFDGTLNALAVAGGQAASGQTKYLEVTAAGGAQELADQLRAITSELITSCEFEVVPPSGFSPDLTNVEVDGVTLPQEGNWELDQSSNPPVIRLLGSACDDIEMRGADAVRITFGCPTVVR